MTKTSSVYQTQTWHGVRKSMAFILQAIRKRSIEANNLVDLKHDQEKAVNCLSEGSVSAVMPTGRFYISAVCIPIL